MWTRTNGIYSALESGATNILIVGQGGAYYPLLGFRFAMSQPQRLSSLTTFGVTAAVNGTRKKIKLLWIAYASASCVHMPRNVPSQRGVA